LGSTVLEQFVIVTETADLPVAPPSPVEEVGIVVERIPAVEDQGSGRAAREVKRLAVYHSGAGASRTRVGTQQGPSIVVSVELIGQIEPKTVVPPSSVHEIQVKV
jgi:hypothetical protein